MLAEHWPRKCKCESQCCYIVTRHKMTVGGGPTTRVFLWQSMALIAEDSFDSDKSTFEAVRMFVMMASRPLRNE